MKYAICLLLSVMIGCGATASAAPAPGSPLREVVDQRLRGDRTGACLAVAVIDHAQVSQTFRCADEREDGRIGPRTAFEIGSVTKTMTAALLARLIERGEASLDDPLARFLPPDVAVPTHQGAPILLRHVVTHTSGLPTLPDIPLRDPQDPYAALTEAQVLHALGAVTLHEPPGTRYDYSNFAMMVLSAALARQAETSFPELLAREVFTPLGMKGAYVTSPPMDVEPAQGHSPNHARTPAWHFPGNLAGVGGVRATLDDMVRYVRAQLGQVASPLGPALTRTQARIPEAPVPFAMNWFIATSLDRTIYLHEGATGGFSSLVAFDVVNQRGAVILSDTSWNTLGGLGDFGLHLLDARVPIGAPHVARTAPPELLAASAGSYVVQLPTGPLALELRVEKGELVGQAQGQSAFALGYDSAGDFYGRDVDLVLRPSKRAEDPPFTLLQGRGAFPVSRAAATP